MNILLKVTIWLFELLVALILALGFLIFFFSFKRDDDPTLVRGNDVKTES